MPKFSLKMMCEDEEKQKVLRFHSIPLFSRKFRLQSHKLYSANLTKYTSQTTQALCAEH